MCIQREFTDRHRYDDYQDKGSGPPSKLVGPSSKYKGSYTPLPYVKNLLGEGLKFLEFLGASETLGGIS